MTPALDIDALIQEANEKTDKARATPAAQELNDLVDAWIASKDAQKEREALETFMASIDYCKLPYNVRNARFITGSKLQTFGDLPYACKMKYEDGIEFPWSDTDKMVRGRAIDDLKTHGLEYFNKEYVVVDRRTKAGKEIAEATEAAGGYVITTTTRDKIMRANEQALQHPLFPRTWVKRNIVWLWGGKYPCKAELDNFVPRERGDDLKFTDNIINFHPMRYSVQQGFYFQAVLERDMEKLPMRLCVVDAGTAFSRAHVWEFGIKTLEGEQGNISRLLHGYIDCKESGIWPDLGNSGDLDILKRYWESDYYPVLPNRFASVPSKL